MSTETGHIIGAALAANAHRSADTAGSRPDGFCGICGEDRAVPSVKLCPHHPGLDVLDDAGRRALAAARASYRRSRFA